MIPANFKTEELHPERLTEEGGALEKLFVRLVFDLYVSDYPSLSFHSGGGKDGAIDLWADSAGHRVVIECKQIGHEIKQQGWEAAVSRWREVRRLLEKWLPLGVDKCHAPYKAWFQLDPKIVKYVFVASCPIFPVHHKDELRIEIKAAFTALSKTANGLAHLADMTVEVVDWNDLCRRLDSRPGCMFKWFRNSTIPGLRVFSSSQKYSGFRKYQHDSVLPYYSIRAHLNSYPCETVQNEKMLWNTLADSSAGLVISGVGGIGKSRLMLEIATLAERDGWVVFEAFQSVTADAVERIARRYESSGVLFLFDYLENLPEFRRISLNLVQFAGDRLRVRFIASARETFVASNEMFEESVVVFRYSPRDTGNADWWQTYQSATVSHISMHLGIRGTTTDIPAVAVLDSELNADAMTDGNAEGAQRWVDKRLKLLHKHGVSRKQLALLAAQLPLNSGADVRLAEEARQVFIVLCKEGWIEPRDAPDGSQEFWMVHDYLSDQIVLNWLAVDGPHSASKEPELRELLKLAYSLGSLTSLIGTLQRILNQPSGFDLDTFSNLIESEISSNADLWKLHRRDLLYTRLLGALDKVSLLHRLRSYWHGAEAETWFQLEIAALAKAIAARDDLRRRIDSDMWDSFQKYVVSLASDADERNMLVNYGLRLMPGNADLQRIAQSWLVRFGECFGATYVIRAWLDKGLPYRQIETSVRLWLGYFGHSVDAQFVLAAWMRASKSDGIRRFESEVLVWSSQHHHSVEAQHVFSAWLDAAGNPAAIRNYVIEWLRIHGRLKEEASHLLRSWLRAGGMPKDILVPFVEWIRAHGRTDSASFVYNASAEKAELQDVVREPMLEWINERSRLHLASFCIAQWLVAGLPRDRIAKAVREWLEANKASAEAGEVIGAWFRAKGKIDMVLPYVPAWIEAHASNTKAAFLLSELVKHESIPDEAKAVTLKWLEGNSRAIGSEKVLSNWLEGRHGVEPVRAVVTTWCSTFSRERDARYLFEKWVAAGGDGGTIHGAAITWLSVHGTELEAGRVFSALLKSGVPPKEYVEYLKGWTPLHRRSREATYFYSSWLNRRPRVPAKAIAPSVLAWLEEHAEWADADFVLNAWLKHENADIEIVRSGYERWMARYSTDRRARDVQRNWERATERERIQRLKN